MRSEKKARLPHRKHQYTILYNFNLKQNSLYQITQCTIFTTELLLPNNQNFSQNQTRQSETLRTNLVTTIY